MGNQSTRPGIVLLTGIFASLTLKACPDLSNLYQTLAVNPEQAELELSELVDACSESSEYFAMLGAARLASGNLFQALENLELSLLIDPDNGSALVDYAEVMYRQGDIFSALELNSELLTRDDLPSGLKGALSARQRRWERERIQRNLIVAGFVGYDHNLNSAPVSDQLALTLSGNSVILDVSPEYQAQEGAYAKVLTGANFRRLGRSLSGQFSGQITGRFSDDSQHELLQASNQVVITETRSQPRWDAFFRLDHVVYGGNSIFSSSTVMARYLFRPDRACVVYPKAAFQYQYFYEQRSLTGVEKSFGVGADCNLRWLGVANRVGMEVSHLSNEGTRSGRLGSDRDGWRMNLVWRRQIGAGAIFAQYVQTQLDDSEGYSPIFDLGQKREETLNSFFVQYTRPLTRLGRTAQFFSNLSYHDQNSTIDLFKTRGFATEIGINWGL